jgi:hypothetical protein
MRLPSLTFLIAPIFVLNLFVSTPAYSQFKEIPKETKSKINQATI